jgi:hypothetical protein
LEPGDEGVQFLVTEGTRADGVRDLTARLAWKTVPEGILQIDSQGFARPLNAGKTEVQGAREGKVVARADVTVAAREKRPWDFATDISPLLSRYGCNAASCHGKPGGQNGFHLSLFAYDFAGDFQALTREDGGRRVMGLDPEQSLLIRKATGRTPHTGGQRITPGTDSYRTLLGWIKAGAPWSQGKTHGALAAVNVEPADIRLDAPGPQQLRIVATYDDGHKRDVTRLSTYRVNDDSVASIDSTGRAVLTRRAEVDLVVRYQSKVVASRLGTIINPASKFDFAKLPCENLIDEELYKRLASLKVPPSPPAGDATFLRRVTLDLTGQQPQPEAIKEFLADKDPKKRAKVVDKLIGTKDFLSFWQIKLGDMLQISFQRFPNGAGYYEGWLATRLQENTPWDAMVHELLTAVGDPNRFGGGPVNYALDGADAKVQAEQTAQRFLGLRLRCAQCHDHPFDVWTQDDYYGLAAFFAKVDRGAAQNGGMMGRPIVGVNPSGQIEHLRTHKPAVPQLLTGEKVELKATDDPRKALADWMTRPDNPFFARAMANWVWGQFFGKGLADPTDDLSRSNPPVHPELLDALAKHFVDSKYDLRDLIRTIATSNAYGTSSQPTKENEADHRLFSHQSARPLTAHQMADAIAQATDVQNRFGPQLVVRKAIEVNDPGTPSAILDAFGRCPRTNGCSTVPTPSLSLRQALMLIGGDVVESKVSSLNGYLSNLLELNPEPADVVESLYLRTLCRPPSAEEASYWTAELKASSAFPEACEDLFWSLLNSREFAFNH